MSYVEDGIVLIDNLDLLIILRFDKIKRVCTSLPIRYKAIIITLPGASS